MTSIPKRGLLLCAALLALAGSGCVPQTEVIKLYDNTDRAAQHYQRLLVVSVIDDPGTRRRLEELIAGNLNSTRATGIMAHQEVGLATNLLQEEIDAAAKYTGADAILMTHIVSVDTRVDVEEGRTDVVSECRGGEPLDYFLYDRREIKEPDTVKFAHTVIAVTSLYSAADGERLWTIQSTCFEKASMDDVLREEAGAIVRQLQLDDLIG
jgi:hypothetical protein